MMKKMWNLLEIGHEWNPSQILVPPYLLPEMQKFTTKLKKSFPRVEIQTDESYHMKACYLYSNNRRLGEMKEIERESGINIGSGEMSDPISHKLINSYFEGGTLKPEAPEFVRRSWKMAS
eukprot:TRINITY_DN7127_c1_g1_i2.p1 TRINITY_DN7127_c1_g1~~TRINITY_DN7127_c1_g1_i2.p1  ORF type:complete len:120 (-),score=6.31 TRINITY_DN7127_c1_g1_i2:76-435(-)